MDFSVKTAGAMEEDIESMHVESSPDKQSGADIQHYVNAFAIDSHSPTSHIVESAPWHCINSHACL